ncbi:hypothetical protein C4K37_3448 [Pseudomonas chlororaphis subsp. piscium]|nr:hypothetical protein C4K37_3448 [Pseudomonas chlororaphis subsp. piscium]AZC44383.1 hypothetical protein C4K36_3458 [Pseudomonas chlororaphis subsp. piscium]AZC51036.1 hypothetical protein C4K35_3453 [Pseudomonas chlororaphis subsp. piscium]AZC57615.1 hypothetical protein C4K34_3450 [Pseudomonas chlororaphis subsp. piscium]AZC63828.1 hypothetical protein C4K33_3336 [Pseudomonas chlororaphis subsp. piscium]
MQGPCREAGGRKQWAGRRVARRQLLPSQQRINKSTCSTAYL